MPLMGHVAQDVGRSGLFRPLASLQPCFQGRQEGTEQAIPCPSLPRVPFLTQTLPGTFPPVANGTQGPSASDNGPAGQSCCRAAYVRWHIFVGEPNNVSED